MTLHDVRWIQYEADQKRWEYEGVARERLRVHDHLVARRRERKANRRLWWAALRARIGGRIPRLQPTVDSPARPWPAAGDARSHPGASA
jgi:hypothetical protein